MNLTIHLLLLPGLVIGLTCHELAHAWTASLLGDDFPRRQGRISLDPFRHLSLLGTLALFVLHFGWAKPVRVNPYNFRRPRRDYLLTSLAGPAANLLIIAACLALMQLTRRSFLLGPRGVIFVDLAHVFLVLVVLINAILATLNLLPIPPLDGSKIWPVLIPTLSLDFGAKWSRLSVLLLVVLLWTDAIDPVFRFVVAGVQRAMPVRDSDRFEDLHHRGHKAYDDARYEEVLRHFGAAAAINPWSPEALVSRAYAQWQLSNWQAALADIDAAMRLCPPGPEDLEFRASCYDMLERAAEAQRDRQAAARLRSATQPATQPPATATGPA